ncbi:hypothetical protein R1sor_021489 [Riccia sorocarpa]|uniref:Uncharacterized protein n=1 Tax=Riccia sorocarpa TaxID=122646 RepID=A0ABD3GHY9_9MARC
MNSQPVSDTNQEKCVKVMVLWSRSLKRVLYLECGKGFADILLSLLIMPVGSILEVLDEAGLAKDIDRGLSKLYVSLRELESTLFCVDKKVLVDPCPPFKSNGYLRLTASVRNTCANPSCQNLVSYARQLCGTCGIGPATFKCTGCSREDNHYVNNRTECSGCGKPVQRVYTIKSSANSAPVKGEKGDACGGFLEENITFIIKEDLSIIKSSTIASMAILKAYNLNNFQTMDMEEITVGRQTGLLLVRAALTSSRPLTEIFKTFFENSSTENEGVGVTPVG